MDTLVNSRPEANFCNFYHTFVFDLSWEFFWASKQCLKQIILIEVFSSLVFSTLYFCRISPLGTILSNRKIDTVELTEEIVDTILSCLVRKCLLSGRIFFSYQWYHHCVLLHLFNNIVRSGDKLSFSFYAATSHFENSNLKAETKKLVLK